MAKKTKRANGASKSRTKRPAARTTAARPAQIGVNGLPTDKINNAVEEIEAALARKEQAHMEYMNKASRISQDITAIYDAAKEAGIPKKELKAVIRHRGLEKKIERLRDQLEPDQQTNFDAIRFALGDLADLPLGQAALKQAEASGAVDDLTQ